MAEVGGIRTGHGASRGDANTRSSEGIALLTRTELQKRVLPVTQMNLPLSLTEVVTVLPEKQ